MKLEEITLTPEKAKEFLINQERNRGHSKSAVRRLSIALQKGEWRKNNDAICIDNNGHMINGQHRCLAIIKTGISVPVILATGYEPNDIFVMDQAIKTRSGGDALSIIGVPNAREVAATLSVLSVYIEQVYHTVSRTASVLSPKSILIEYEKYKREIHNSTHFTNNLLHRAEMRFIKGSICTFCHFAFLKAGTDDPDQFFESLVIGSLLIGGSPILQLRNKLIRNHVSLAKLGKLSILALVIKAWNMDCGASRAKRLTYSYSHNRFPTIYGEPFKGTYSPWHPVGTK